MSFSDVVIASLITLFYLFGGQIEKGVRRYGVPNLLIIYAMLSDKKTKWTAKLKYLVLWALMGILSMGYGESSFIRKLLGGSDRLTRLVYSLMIAGIFTIINVTFWWYYIIVLASCFQVYAGSLFSFKIGSRQVDILIEDIFRALAIFACSYIMLI